MRRNFADEIQIKRVSSPSEMPFTSFAPALGGNTIEVISISLPFAIDSGMVGVNGVLHQLFFRKTRPAKTKKKWMPSIRRKFRQKRF